MHPSEDAGEFGGLHIDSNPSLLRQFRYLPQDNRGDTPRSVRKQPTLDCGKPTIQRVDQNMRVKIQHPTSNRLTECHP